MPYTPTSWVSGTTPVDAPEQNNLETQYTEATNSWNQDLFTPWVVSGLVATKDGITANKLDVTAGVAYLLQADNTLRRRAPVSSNQTTVTISSTYHLYLQPDGSWYWNTANTPAANSLFVAQVTTDGSGNILAVTDERNLVVQFLMATSGLIGVPDGFSYNPVAINGETINSLNVKATNPGGGGGNADITFTNSSTGKVNFAMGSGTAFIDTHGHLNDATGQVVVTGAGNLANTPIEVIVVGPDSSHLPAAGVKGRVAFVVPFSLP